MFNLLQNCRKLVNPKLAIQVPENLFVRGGKSKACKSKEKSKSAKEGKVNKGGGGEQCKSRSTKPEKRAGSKSTKKEKLDVCDQPEKGSSSKSTKEEKLDKCDTERGFSSKHAKDEKLDVCDQPEKGSSSKSTKEEKLDKCDTERGFSSKHAKDEKLDVCDQPSKEGARDHGKRSVDKSEKGGSKGAKEDQCSKFPSESSGAPRVAINGFGRIGRMVLRVAVEHECPLEIVAVNDACMNAEYMAYVLKYDSTHGQFIGNVEVVDCMLVVDGKQICACSEEDPTNIPWKELGVDFVIEATGKFSSIESASCHLTSGANKVIIATPSEDAPTYVMGVNHDSYNCSEQVVSASSCCTNAVAPLVKVVHDKFGLEEGLMSIINPADSLKRHVDPSSPKGWREGRGGQSIVPTYSGRYEAIDKVIPDLKGNISAISIGVPTTTVSLIDLTCRLKKDASIEDITCAMTEASKGPLLGILGVTDEEVVSSDFVGSPYSCIFDSKASMMLNKKFVKLMAWYDNEYGYSCRVIDLLKMIHSKCSQ